MAKKSEGHFYLVFLVNLHFEQFFEQSEDHLPAAAEIVTVVVAELHLIHHSAIIIHEAEMSERAHIIITARDFKRFGTGHGIDALAKLFRVHREAAVPTEKPIDTGPKLFLVQDFPLPVDFAN